MKWTLITDFDSCLVYATKLKLGIVKQYPGWIPQYQKEICEICDRIRNESGQTTWFYLEFKPFQVRYKSGQFYFKKIDIDIPVPL